MIPGISIIVFLKCKDSSIRDFLFQWFVVFVVQCPRGYWRLVGWVAAPGDRTWPPHSNEARYPLMEQIQEKQTCDVPSWGGPESVSEQGRTLAVCLCVSACDRVTRRVNRKMIAWCYQYCNWLHTFCRTTLPHTNTHQTPDSIVHSVASLYVWTHQAS